MKRKKNTILEDNGDWLLINISTPKHPNASMAVDKSFWKEYRGGRVCSALVSASKYIYAIAFVSGKLKNFHRLVLNVKDGQQVDHICHGTMSYIDNRRSNLRAVTRSQNQMNRARQSNNKSGVAGVCLYKSTSSWQAKIHVNRKKIHLGYFKNKTDAIKARKEAELKYFGEYAFDSVKQKSTGGEGICNSCNLSKGAE